MSHPDPATLGPAIAPTLLLPVRLETRRVDADLLVRIYPDLWHHYAHNPTLTVAEGQAATQFWAADDADRLAVWTQLRRRFGTGRATWLVRATVDGVPAPATLRPNAWDAPMMARALPERWFVVAHPMDGSAPIVASGKPITGPLPIGPAPAVTDEEGPADDGMAWMVDFRLAEAAGMAVRLSGAPDLARLVVVGTRAGDPAAGASELTDLLTGHLYTDGLSLLAQGIPTNAADAPTDPDDATTLADALGTPATSDPGLDGARAAALLGLDPSLLVRIPGGDGHENQDAQAANALLWFTGWGRLLLRLITPVTDKEWADTYQHYVDFVRARGPAAALRIGNQPYGLLPVEVDPTTPRDNDPPTRHILTGLAPRWQLAGAQQIGLPVPETLRASPRPTGYAARGIWTLAGDQTAPWDAHWTHFTGQSRADVLKDAAATAAHGDAPQNGLDFTVPWQGGTLLRPGTAASAADPFTAQPLTLPAVPGPDDLAAQLTALAAASTNDLHHDLATVPGPDSLFRVLARAALLTAAAATATTLPAPETSLPRRGRLDGVADDDTHDAVAAAAAALRLLSTRTPQELSRLLAEQVELTSTGWHAWTTALATERIAHARQAGVRGIVLGGYGVVQGFLPATSTTSVSHGYLQAPSVAQAATAAILHSAHLRHADDATTGRTPMTVDLSSRRARIATRLLAGVSAGQSLGALLGYRLERALQEAHHGDYIAPLRALAPTGDSPSAVVDGLAISRRRHSTDPIPWEATVAGYPLGPEDRIAAILDDLDDCCDAVADALLAEGVHAATTGRVTAGFAALDTAARGTATMPDLTFLNTPRTGIDLTHRILCLAPAAGPPGWPTTVRTQTHPALAAWAAQSLGPAGDVTVAAQPVDVTTGADQPTDPLPIPLSSLGLGPLDLIAAAAQPAELDAWLRWSIARDPSLVALPAATTLRVADPPTQQRLAGARSLNAVLAIARAAADLLSRTRGLDARDLNPPGHVDPDADLPELQSRVISLLERARTTQSALAAYAAGTGADADAVAALQTAWQLGIRGALTAAAASPALTAAVLRPVAADVANRLHARLVRLADPPAELQALTDAVHTVTTDPFPVSATLSGATADDLSAAVAATSLEAATVAQDPQSWLTRIVQVSPPVAALETLLACCDLAGTDADQALSIGQLPTPTDGIPRPWIGLPLSDSSRSGRAALPARVSLVLVGVTPQHAATPLAGFLVDSWAETIPHTSEIAGLTFHHQTPQAQPPQAALVVAPDSTDPQQQWTVNQLAGAVDSALALARARLAQPQDLPAWAPTPALSLDGTGPATTRPPDGTGTPLERLIVSPPQLGIVDTDQQPAITALKATGQRLVQGASATFQITGANLDGARYSTDSPLVSITQVAGLDITLYAATNASPCTLYANTSNGQSLGIAVPVAPQPRLLAVQAPTTLWQDEHATSATFTLVGQGLGTVTAAAVVGNDGRHDVVVATQPPRQSTSGGLDLVAITLTIAGAPQPVSDWNPSERGGPLRPKVHHWVAEYTYVGLTVSLTHGAGSPVNTAGLTPGLGLNRLSWEERP